MRSVLITGAAGGIGAAIARSFHALGDATTLVDIDRSGLAVLEETIADGDAAQGVVADVSTSPGAAAAIKAVAERFNRLDLVVNAAGIAPTAAIRPLDELPVETWDAVLAANLRSAFLVTKYSIPMLRRSNQAVIINIASTQALQSMAQTAAYTASKSALLGLTRSTALDHADEGIRAIAICPGTIDTPLIRAVAEAEGPDTDATIRRFGEVHPLGRIGTPEDVANAVIFLCDPRASFITGSYLCVDGGYIAQGSWAHGAGSAVMLSDPG